ncbi:glutamate-5-semialdehyde dehydrogenase [Oscillibacter ruminantium]|uniref:glutamate-5-semialdehyde dehydrogenase n=1 Tax=Oscillibacter ruminantium TaxID=1263547 RepID=UPI000311FCD4|nr:glutamate-5-semialdehyde dehydrogenase [Oscillibacter ruminantium]
MTVLERQGQAAKSAGRTLAIAGTAKKNAALEAIARALIEKQDLWLAANAEDVAAAKEAGIRPAMLDRLTLTPERIADIVAGVRQVAALPDPIGVVTKMETRPNGLIIGRRRVPLGVIAIIFEARPNVTVDAAALCLKSGNACILRGGKEAIRSNRAVAELMRGALESVGLSADCVSLVQDTSHETADELMNLTAYVDVLIPRGGANLIRSIAKNASVPVIRTGEGVCHVYIDSEADLDMGAKILYNAKCSRPSVCNAAECVLVAQDVAAEFFKKALPLLKEKNVELRCDEAALSLIGGDAVAAAEADWDAEYDDYILAVHIVKDAAEAIDFINTHGTGHSESIITKNYFTAQHFLDAVDAAAVYVNASTRFTDGGEFGLGAEIGISTQKMHARGPMGLEEMTSCKYVIYGEGQVRE